MPHHISMPSSLYTFLAYYTLPAYERSTLENWSMSKHAAKSTLAADESAVVLEVLKDGGGMIVEDSDRSESNGAVECQAYEPRQHYHRSIIQI